MSLPSPLQADDDGRSRFGRNIAFVWGGYTVNLISGFIVPRMINDHLGQFTLGVWDFAWSFVSYFGLVQIGMGGSISRYVSYYRAKMDVVGLNQSVSTIAIFQRAVGWLALLLAVISAVWILPLFATRLGGELYEARWVLIILGTQIALTISLSVYGAVMVGCHRWDIHNIVSAAAYGLVAIGMILTLLLGAGLPSLAFVHCAVMVAADLLRRHLVNGVCPELRLDRRLASWPILIEQAQYSIKSLTPSISMLLSNQTMSLLITAFLGPSSLAVFSRARSLMTTLRTLSAKFGMIVVPTASALLAKNDNLALRDTLLTAPAFVSCMALPILISLSVYGDQLIAWWMGPSYVIPGLLTLLCAGSYATLIQEPVWSLLSGMNIHGKIALAKLGAALVSAFGIIVSLWFLHWKLLGATMCFVVPQILLDGILTPWYACRVIGVPKGLFLWRIVLRPALCVIPFGTSVVITDLVVSKRPILILCILFVGSIISSFCYIRWLIPSSIKQKCAERARCMLPNIVID